MITTHGGEYTSDSDDYHDQLLGTGQGGNRLGCKSAAIQPPRGTLMDERGAPLSLYGGGPEIRGGGSDRDRDTYWGGDRDSGVDDRDGATGTV